MIVLIENPTEVFVLMKSSGRDLNMLDVIVINSIL